MKPIRFPSPENSLFIDLPCLIFRLDYLSARFEVKSKTIMIPSLLGHGQVISYR